MRRLKSMRFAVTTALSPLWIKRPEKGGGCNQLSFARPSGPGATVAASEFFHAPGSVDEFLLASEKRMAGGADADFNVSFGRASVIHRPARTNHIGVLIIGMNVRLHVKKKQK